MRLTAIFFLLVLGLSAQGVECPVDEIGSNASAAGTLGASDCKLNEVIRLATDATPVKQYRLVVGERGVHEIQVTSGEFDTTLYLYNGTRTLRYAFSDDASGAGTNSRVIANLPPATYLVLVGGKTAESAGKFDLKVSSQVPRECTLEDLALGTEVEAAFRAEGCRGLDLATGAALSTDATLLKLYRTEIPRRGVVSVDPGGTGITILQLSPRTGTTGRTFSSDRNGRLLASELPGSYILYAGARAEGTIRIKTSFEDLRACPPSNLTPPSGESSGELTEAKCRVLDFFVPSNDAAPIDLYMLQVAERAVVTVDMKSSAFDPYLILMSLNRSPLAENDDASRDTLDSRITIHLPAGNYWLLTTEIDGGRGAYTLEAKAEAPRACEPIELSFSAPAEGTLRDAGCRVLDAVQLSTDARVATPYRFLTDSRQVFRASVDAPGSLPGALVVADKNGRNIFRAALDRDGAGDVEMLLNPGEYQLLLAATAAEPPAYKLQGSLRTPPACPIEEIGLNATVEGALAPQDCQILEMVAEAPLSSPARQYRVNATGPGRLSVTLSSGVIEPLVIVVDEQDRPVAVNLAVAPGTLATTANLVRGNYRVLVSTLQSAGSFSLKTEFQASGIITPPIGEDEPEQTIEPSSWVMDALRRLQGAAVELERASSPKLRREE